MTECNTDRHSDKVFLHLQACFANITFDDLKKSSDSTSMMGTQMAIFKDAPRVAKGTYSCDPPPPLGGEF